ncbi:MAG: hypothetical protein ACE5KT_10655 [Methanosarcinales archaeon]
MQESLEENIKKWKKEIKELEKKLPNLSDSVEISKVIGRIGTFEHFIWLEKEKLKQKMH